MAHSSKSLFFFPYHYYIIKYFLCNFFPQKICLLQIENSSNSKKQPLGCLSSSHQHHLVQRMYHDIFDDQGTAQSYADNLKLHDFKYPTSVVTFHVCNKGKVSQEKWYRQQKKAMRLTEEKGQTYLDESFCIFAKTHIENLKKPPTKEAA